MMCPAQHPGFSPLRIFLSYGHDAYISFAQKLRDDLISRGHEVWFDVDRLKAGTDWEQYIEEGLAWASGAGKNGRFILLMTPFSVRRPDGFCLNELARAAQLNLRVLPVMVSLCEPPLSICRIQWLDMRDCALLADPSKYREKLNTLLEAIEHDRLDTDGFHNSLFNMLQPISFDAEIKYNIEKFTGRAWVLEELERWLADRNAQRVFFITAAPGVGKTVLSAWLCSHWREIGAFHFCRHDNIQKIDPRRCIMSIAYQLSTQLPEYEDRLQGINISGLDELNARSLFDHLIVQPLSANFPVPDHLVVILIDSLDEATVDGKNDLASFLASEFERTPDWLRLIVTSRPDPDVMGQLQAYTPFVIDLNDDRNQRDIQEFLTREIGADIDPRDIEKISKKCNGFFIYADLIIKELKYKRLSMKNIDDFPQGLGGIYLKYMERQFPDIKIWETNVRPALEVITASQEPMRLKALSSIFNWNNHEERSFKRSLGAIFIMDKEGIKPFHKSVIDWLTNEEKQDPYFVSVTEGHRYLANYLIKEYREDVWDNPLLKYLPLHLCMARQSEDLKAVMQDLKFIQHEWQLNRFDVLTLWTIIEAHSTLRMTDTYRSTIESPASHSDKDLLVIANLLKSTFHFEEAIKIYEYLVNFYRHNGDAKGLQKTIGDLAWILYNSCDYDAAMALLTEQEAMCRAMGDQDGIQSALLNKANILWLKNDFNTAMQLLTEQEHICRETGNMEGLQESLWNQSLILRVKGQYNESMKLLKEQERLCRILGNLDGLQQSYCYQALILMVWGRLDDSMALLKEQMEISEKIQSKQMILSSLSLQARILILQGDLDGAQELQAQVVKKIDKTGDRYEIQDFLITKAIILRLKGDLAGALDLLHEAQGVCREIDNKYGLQLALGQEAIILRMKGDLNGAWLLHKEEERICREIGHKRDLAMSLSNQAVVLRMKGDLNGALALHDVSEKMLMEIGYKYGLQECLGEEAMTLYAKGEIDMPLTLLIVQEKICRDMKLKLDLEKCMENQRRIFSSISSFENEEQEEKCLALSRRESR